ncbi:mevalonate kinase family protein [Gemella bergeri]|uniref:mevalonate kinase family protein n=1 Tax=Gemella bergeri TaxID=84136 RepID=UPI00041D4DD9|nr:phosphomevalonate kinase [Gemella bergeri]
MEQKNNHVYGVAYGKLYIAGEYAILEDYSKAILLGVPKKITAIIEQSDTTTIFDTLYNKKVTLDENNKDFHLIQNFIKFIQNYLKSKNSFSLTILNELHGKNSKYGLGSSGAVLVAIAKAMFNFEKITFDDLLIFKLVVLYNIKHNIYSSMGDVAGSLTQGLTYYEKFSHSKLLSLIEKSSSDKEVIESSWHGLIIRKISTNIPIELFAHWTGDSIDTREHIKLWNNNKSSKIDNYLTFIKQSNTLVSELYLTFFTNDANIFLNTINKIRKNLLFLESFSNIPMETAPMKKYIEKFPAGKQSGSGSGDIVLGFKNSGKPFSINLILKELQIN